MCLNIKFGVSTWLWTSPFNSEAIALFPKIKQMGFDVVELPVEDPGLIDVSKIKEALNENGLQAVICGAFGTSRDLTHDDRSYQKKSFEYIIACLKICSQLGVPFFAGPMYSAVGKARLVSTEQRKIEWDRAVINLKKVCHIAKDMGLEIALEPLNRFESDMINTCEDVMRLIAEIDDPSAKVLLDGFHMNIEEKSLEEALILAGSKLIHVQVSENHRGTPGTGQTQWNALRKGLEAINYSGAVSIESFTPEVKELAGSVCIWRPLSVNQDSFASEGLKFLKEWATLK
jgi:D-psicose/D-tagatose/L-ribulose 3-epimerase